MTNASVGRAPHLSSIWPVTSCASDAAAKTKKARAPIIDADSSLKDVKVFEIVVASPTRRSSKISGNATVVDWNTMLPSTAVI